MTFYQLSTVVMLSQKKFDLRNLLRGDVSIIVPSLIVLGQVLDTFSNGGRSGGRAGGRAGGLVENG